MRFLTGHERRTGVLLWAWAIVLAVQLPLVGEIRYETLIVHARVVDGSGAPGFLGDVAIQGDRIQRVAPPRSLDPTQAERVIDARGHILAPGFIDILSQSKAALLYGDGRVVSKVTQGVTTEIMGEGVTDAPGPRFRGRHAFGKWLRALQRRGASANFGSFLGASTLRTHVMGLSSRTPSQRELETMKRVLRNAMLDGAFGLASALLYQPGSFASTAELTEVSKAMAPHGGIYITHLRSEGDRLIEALDEAIQIGRDAGVSVEIYHLKAAGEANWARLDQAISRIGRARAQGLDVGADMYPYTGASTGLTSCLPPGASEGGGLFEALDDPARRAAIRAEVLEPTRPWENLCRLATPRGVLLLGLKRPENKRYVGMRLSQIAASQGKEWIDAAIDLMRSERQGIDSVFFMMDEGNIRKQLSLPWMTFGTDAGGEDPENPRGLVHPRAYGTYPRILGRYVREERILSLEEAVRKMSSAVADRLSIDQRGRIREGFYADLVIFDPETVIDRATYENPHRVSSGIRDVLVNGVPVVRDGRHTGRKPGRIVRGSGYGPPERTSEAGDG